MRGVVKPAGPGNYDEVERLYGLCYRTNKLAVILFDNNSIRVVRFFDPTGLFKNYYNRSRSHASLDGNTPADVSGDSGTLPVPLHSFAWQMHCGGLFQLPVAA